MREMFLVSGRANGRRAGAVFKTHAEAVAWMDGWTTEGDAEVQRLKAELAEARKDSERLNWLMDLWLGDELGEYFFGGSVLERKHIDAATKEGKNGNIGICDVVGDDASRLYMALCGGRHRCIRL